MSTAALVEKIRSDGQARVAGINNNRDKKIAEIEERLANEVNELEQEYQERIERETRLIKERVGSRARLEQRKNLLAAKWEVIERVLESAQTQVLEDEKYPQLIKDIVERYAPSDSVVRLSAADTEKFGRKLGVELGEPAGIKGGVIIEKKKQRQILDFSVEETLGAIREELASELAGLLFPESGSRKRGDKGR